MGFNSKFQIATCKHCNRPTDISNSNYVQKLIIQNKSQKEEINSLSKKLNKVRLEKNGTIQKLHQEIRMLLELMTDEQKEKAKQINQLMREEIKRHELDRP